VPSEGLYSSALEDDPGLLERAASKNVMLTTPVTLMALLRAVSFGWQQEDITRNAREISGLASELHGRLSTVVGHFDKLRNSLSGSVANYNRLARSLDTRVLPTLRKFPEMGVTSGSEVADVVLIDETPQALEAGDLRASAARSMDEPDDPFNAEMDDDEEIATG